MLEIKGLNSGYGEALVLQEFSCFIPEGKITALMGRNGMGKTTLLKTIMGLIRASSGQICLQDVPIQKLETYKISQSGIGYVPQGREVFEQFTVYENLRLAALGSSLKNLEILPQIYNWFPILEERRDQRAGTFSGGQQQILAIARALVTRPKLLLLDEPTEGIQPSIVHEIGVKLSEIASTTGLTVLLVEQNVDMVKTMANTVAFIENGKLMEQVDIHDLEENDALLQRYLSI
ncbi:ABC transporter ATP-binding protein [Sneathiella aquimaris]|uniref:ABC transporter ATP-binding protein n=1 Tax=Sneathiella aquimaris TaxID=2599305 RepID=UPI00146C94A9|nr:ABC transporter ATP-binding protein [Sneathiella aquimaris]